MRLLSCLTSADLAIENAGGIRGGIAAGNVTAGNVIAISPYGNTVETWTMTGADFLAALEHSLQISDDCNDSYELQQAYVAPVTPSRRRKTSTSGAMTLAAFSPLAAST